ncbi:MAG: hypothetical protein GX638_16535 [Crenarchaeota archaeon]|nr:hypothetical protein [Thermoproteota archaeon]
MNIYDEAIEKVDWIFSTSKIPNYELRSICVALERAKKVEELLGLKNEQLSIFQFERNHFCSMTNESYEKLKVLDYQILKLEEEMKK